MLGTKHSADSLEYFSYFSQKIDSNFKEIVSLAENLHEMLKLIFSKKKTKKKKQKKKKKHTKKKKKKTNMKNIVSLSSAELAQRVLKFNKFKYCC